MDGWKMISLLNGPFSGDMFNFGGLFHPTIREAQKLTEPIWDPRLLVARNQFPTFAIRVSMGP